MKAFVSQKAAAGHAALHNAPDRRDTPQDDVQIM